MNLNRICEMSAMSLLDAQFFLETELARRFEYFSVNQTVRLKLDPSFKLKIRGVTDLPGFGNTRQYHLIADNEPIGNWRKGSELTLDPNFILEENKFQHMSFETLLEIQIPLNWEMSKRIGGCRIGQVAEINFRDGRKSSYDKLIGTITGELLNVDSIKYYLHSEREGRNYGWFDLHDLKLLSPHSVPMDY